VYINQSHRSRPFFEEGKTLGTGNDIAIEQGFAACLSYLKPMIWPLTKDKGYFFGGQPELIVPETMNLPVVEMEDLIQAKHKMCR
jgi:hypothetical protein